MSIKVICRTKAFGEVSGRVVLERSSTPGHLIEVADQFLDLFAEYAELQGDTFDGLVCTLDDIEIQTRLLIENVSTPFFQLRHSHFKGKGFALYKQEADVKCFMRMVKDQAQPKQLPPPLWVGFKTKKSTPLPNPSTAQEGDAVRPQDDSSQPQRKRLRPGNLGNLGNL